MKKTAEEIRREVDLAVYHGTTQDLVTGEYAGKTGRQLAAFVGISIDETERILAENSDVDVVLLPPNEDRLSVAAYIHRVRAIELANDFERRTLDAKAKIAEENAERAKALQIESLEETVAELRRLAEDAETDLEAKDEELGNIEARMDEMASELDDLRRNFAALESDREIANAKMLDAVEEFSMAEAALAGLKGEID